MPADDRAPGMARLTLASVIPPPRLPRVDDAHLAVSEVVSNAVRHGGLDSSRDSVLLVIEANDELVRVVVEQPTPADRVRMLPPDPASNRRGGFGLRILQETADAWGHVQGPPGRVWFEFRA